MWETRAPRTEWNKRKVQTDLRIAVHLSDEFGSPTLLLVIAPERQLR